MLNDLLNCKFDFFRFLNSTERQKIYLAILFFLYEERLAHQIEIFHDDLYLKVTPDIESLTGQSYHEEFFRQDIEKLVEWGNIVRKLEGRRVRSLSDNSLRRNILKISEETFQLVRYLLQQARPGNRITANRGFFLLQDLNSMLDEFESHLESFFDGKYDNSLLQRSNHLIIEMDSKIDNAVAELTRLADHLHSFLEIGSAFQSETYEQIIAQLQSYNQEWLAKLNSFAGRFFSRLLALEKHLCFDEFISAVSSCAKRDGLIDHDLATKIGLIVAFFNPASGRLDFYCRRVNDELHFAIRRISNYIRLRDDRTIRIQQLRQRLGEMNTAPAETCSDWLNNLFSPTIVPLLAAEGTPDAKSQAPQPRRSAGKTANVRSAQALSPKKLSIEASRDLEKHKIEMLNDFFFSRVLNGKDENQVGNASFTDIDDLKNYLQGLKLAKIKSRKASANLRVDFLNPQTRENTAHFNLPDCEFNCPDHLIRKKE